MEELLKIVQLVREEVPQARVKVDSLMVIHNFTIEELLNICNKYAKYYHEQQLKKSKSDASNQMEMLIDFADWLQSDTSNLNYNFIDLVDTYLKTINSQKQ